MTIQNPIPLPSGQESKIRNPAVWVNPTYPTPEARPPVTQVGVIGWLRANLFSSVGNTLLTLITVALLILFVARLVDWLANDAFWAPVWVNRRLFAVGRYPADRLRQVAAVLLLVTVLFGLSAGRWGSILRFLAAGLGGIYLLLALIPLGYQAQLLFAGLLGVLVAAYVVGLRVRIPGAVLVVGWLVSLPLTFVLLRGGIDLPLLGWTWSFGPELVSPNLWGGLLLTFLLTVTGIALSFPIGVALALGRRSSLPVIRGFCVGYIEIIRGVPLVAILFMAALAMPLLLPPAVPAPSHVFRALIAITAFSAAYLAENVRGGLQAVPKGQYEAADALGFGAWGKLRLIILPQALRAVIPALVGQFISLFKDTSLVTLIGLTEFLGIARVVIQQPEWIQIPGGITREVYLFVAVVYFIFSYGLSTASRRLEAQLGVGKR